MDRNKPDLTKVEIYEQILDTAVEEKRAWLSGMGFSPDDPNDRKTCEWLTWHLSKRF